MNANLHRCRRGRSWYLGRSQTRVILPTSLSRLLRMSLYLQPAWRRNKSSISVGWVQEHCKTRPKLVSPGSPQMPRNCEHSTTDKGNLRDKRTSAVVFSRVVTPLEVPRQLTLTRRCEEGSAAPLRPPLQMRSRTRWSSWQSLCEQNTRIRLKQLELFRGFQEITFS